MSCTAGILYVMYMCAILPCDKDCMRNFRIAKYHGPDSSLLKQGAQKIHQQLIYCPVLTFSRYNTPVLSRVA